MTHSQSLVIDGQSLTIEDVVAVARDPRRPVALAPEARARMARSRAYVESLMRPGAPAVYGVNTGFGIFAERPVAAADAARLSRNLIISHAVATGEPFPVEVVRAAMLIRANTLALGYSGVRVEIVETLLAMLNRGVHPVVPQQGSLGSSGDLAQLSHLALVLSTDAAGRDDESGWADLDGARMTGRAAMEAAGISRIVLGAKEGLALNNGATFSAALAALAVADGENLERNAEVALAMMLEALLGVSAAFHADLHAARRHAGQIAVAAAIRGLIAGSTFVDAGGRVQDPYSLRCAPQVLGPVRETLARVRAWTEAEINAATDNPLIFPDMDGPIKAISGGNFHGEVVGMAMDFLGVALAEVGALAERQVYRLLSDRHSFGLPPMLVDEAAAGLNSGLMMPHYTTASLVLENQTLAHPDTVHSLPTSAGQEDHNANALTAARHARQIVANVTHILAVEFFAVAQAVDLRARMLPEARLAPATAAARACIREAAPFIDGDRLFQADIRAVEELVRGGAIVRAVRAQDDVGLPAGE